MQTIAAVRFDSAAAGLAPRLREALLNLPDTLKSYAQEIRVQIGQPLAVTAGGDSWFVTESGGTRPTPGAGCIQVTGEEIEQSFHILCGYSVHSHGEDLKNGFVTMAGGHRAGLCGTAVWKEGTVSGMRAISSIHLRIARQVEGVGDAVVDTLRTGLCSTLICGPPGSGKTTLLRDVAVQLAAGALGRRLKVAVIDERGELAAVHRGVPQNRMGMCYILDGYPKALGMQMAIRTLAPDLILCDEIGSEADAAGIEQSLHAGVAVIATAHAGRLEALEHRPQLARLLREGAFGQLILLRDAGHPCEIARRVEVIRDEAARPPAARSGGRRFWVDAGETA